MAHYARVSDGVVTDVVVVPDTAEDTGNEYLNGLGLNGLWIKTSYNTYGNVHANGGIALRYNYAGVGYTHDEDRDAFIPPKPDGENWFLNEETCLWETYDEWESS
jgi:hypothetical protein